MYALYQRVYRYATHHYDANDFGYRIEVIVSPGLHDDMDYMCILIADENEHTILLSNEHHAKTDSEQQRADDMVKRAYDLLEPNWGKIERICKTRKQVFFFGEEVEGWRG